MGKSYCECPRWDCMCPPPVAKFKRAKEEQEEKEMRETDQGEGE